MQPPPAAPEKKRTVLWGVATLCGLALAAVLEPAGMAKIGESGSPEQIGYQIGTVIGYWMMLVMGALVVGAIIAGISALFKIRFFRALAVSYSISILILGFVAIAGQAMTRKAKGDRQAIDGLKDDVAQFVAAAGTDADGTPRKIDLNFDAQKDDTSEMGRMRQMLQGFFKDIGAIQNDYLAALDADGINVLLDPARVSSDAGLVESEAIVARLRITVEKFRSKADTLVTSFPDRIDDYQFGDASKAEIARGYQQGITKSMPLMRENWDLEKQVVDHMGELITLLKDTRQEWTVADGAFTFENDADADTFNQILAKIDACAARQTEIRDQSMKDAAASFEGIH